MIRAMIEKDLRLLLADRGALFATFLLPLIFLATFGWIYSGFEGGEKSESSLPKQKLAFGADVEAVLQERIRAALVAGPFEIIACQSESEVEAQVANSSVALGLYLPSNFEPFQGTQGVLYQDSGSDPRFGGALAGAVQGALARAIFSPQLGLLGPRAAEPSSWLEVRSPASLKKSVKLSGFQISTPSNAVLFVFFLVLGVAISFAEERRTGTFARLRSLPIRRAPLLAAKLVPFVLVGCVQMAFLFGTAFLVFGLRMGGDLSALCVLTLAVVLASVGLGFLVAALGGSERQIQSYATLVVLVMGLISGCMIPRWIMPAGAQKFGLFTPHAWALDGYAEVLGREGTTMFDIWPQIGALLGFAVCFSTVGALVFARRH